MPNHPSVKTSQLALVRRIGGYALAALVLFFLGRVLYQSQSELAAQPVRFQPNGGLLLAALGFQVVGLGLSVETWRRLLMEMGSLISFRDGFRIWFFSNLMRYVPGNIWQPATMAILGECEGIPKSQVILSQALFIGLTLSLAGVLSIALLPLSDGVRIGLGLACSVAVLFFAIPPVFRLALGLVARVLRYERVSPQPTLALGLAPLLVAGLMWLTYGLSFFFFIQALGVASGLDWSAAVAIYAGGYLIGYISLLTPSGLGVREGALAFFLGAYFPGPIAVAMALLARLLAIAGELVCVGAAWLGTKFTLGKQHA